MGSEENDFILEKLMIDYGNELVRLAFSYVKDAEIAKDMVQNTFIKCYKNLDSFRFDAQIKTWLYRITINECKDYLKSWNYKMVHVKSFINETAKSILPSTEKTVLDKYNNEEIKDTIFSLPKVYREVVYLYYYDSLTTDEIANVLDVSVNTVKTRLRRAKQRLESMIKEAEVNE
ncbi:MULTISPECIES: sigma-70 family RNA polymerase sigma factor [Lysinibacillus]|uniref:sigma-70 family RNA polymerase sigma factor n=1 Tax=Lysinibacillus TaxID=400634 RepID=UPI001C8C0164|nr:MULTISPECIES: sigma-70 family RNA polymerase sigma factor [Lysinibacillus]MBX8946874.1 sigma-70 family RNA polymerase sigma factor [Lysinibacillus sp. K60]WDU77407.1 sigma-70 family RNA polymerase sigma factor [Lysinibacillus sp. G01H]WHP42691.1 sigma-70 family RNA polymerase sigma factor [Lysinibacillus boronitolerans]